MRSNKMNYPDSDDSYPDVGDSLEKFLGDPEFWRVEPTFSQVAVRIRPKFESALGRTPSIEYVRACRQNESDTDDHEQDHEQWVSGHPVKDGDANEKVHPDEERRGIELRHASADDSKDR